MSRGVGSIVRLLALGAVELVVQGLHLRLPTDGNGSDLRFCGGQITIEATYALP